jgi:hypothetical protein
MVAPAGLVTKTLSGGQERFWPLCSGAATDLDSLHQ